MSTFAVFSNGEIREFENKEAAQKANPNFTFWLILQKKESDKKLYKVEFNQNGQENLLCFGSWKLKEVTITNYPTGGHYFNLDFLLVDVHGEVRSFRSNREILKRIFDLTAYKCKFLYLSVNSIGPLVAISNQLPAFTTWTELEQEKELQDLKLEISELRNQLSKLEEELEKEKKRTN